jgi:hypothetical protein
LKKVQQHLPGDEAWRIGEHRAAGGKKYYLANLPAGMDLRSLAATIKARWICEQTAGCWIAISTNSSLSFSLKAFSRTNLSLAHHLCLESDDQLLVARLLN